jgi:cell division septation protein DedD
VADTSRHATDDGVHEIQLSGKQIVFLFMATTVVSVVIFLCGVLVGRGVQAGRPDQADRAAAAPPPAAPADAAGAAGAGTGTLTYPERLESDKPVAEQLAPPPAVTPPPPKTHEPAAASAATGEDGWVVQVAALRDRDAALAIVKRLTAKGYPAFVLDPTPGSPAPVHRVRVGRYADRAEAERVSRRLEREEQFKPLITR